MCKSVSQRMSPHFSTYSAALRSHTFTLLWEQTSQHASRRSRFLYEHVVTKTEIGASRGPFQRQRRTPPHTTAGIVVQRNKVPSTTLNQRGFERLSVGQLQHLLMNIWTVSSDSSPTIRPYYNVTMPKKMREVHCSSALQVADLFNQTLFSYHPTLSWTSGPVGMIDGVMNVHGHQQERTGVDRLTQVANSRTELKKLSSHKQMSWCTAYLPYHVVSPKNTTYCVRCRNARKSCRSTSRRAVIVHVV